MTKITLLICAFLSTIFTLKAEKTLNDTLNLNEVVVTGTKTEISRKLMPLTISQISRKEIENTGHINILPTLNTYAPGIFVTERNILGFGVSTGSAGSISIRGISGSPNTDVLILIDGHPQYQGLFGHPLADAYVASDVEKVEIIRGPASLLYGSNAMAGTINIITKKASKEGFEASFGTSYGSYNTQKINGTMGYKKKKLNIFLSINNDKTDGVRTNTDFKITNATVKVRYDFNPHWALTGDCSSAKFKGNDNGPTFAPALFGIDITRGKTALSLENRYDQIEGALKIYNNYGEHTLTDGFHSTDHNTGLMLYQTIKPFSGNSLTFGFDLKEFGGKANRGFKHDSLINVNEVAGYIYSQQRLFSKIAISGGLRVENSSIYGNELIPHAGITYNPSNTTTFKSSISKGFRSPTIMELFLFVPNPNLQPERVINYEISYLQSLLSQKLNLELTLFKIKGDNQIQVVGNFPSIRRENTGSFVNRGVELSAKYLLNKNLVATVNYNYLDLDKPMLAAPRQQFNLSANYLYQKWNFNASMQYINRLYSFISPNPVFAPIIEPDYVLCNLRMSYHVAKNFELFATGNNLLNTHYEINKGYPLAGANFSAGINLKL